MTDLYTLKWGNFIIEIECESSLTRAVIKKQNKTGCLRRVVLKLERAAVLGEVA